MPRKAKLVVTPWKWHFELIEVRGWYYSPSRTSGVDCRRKACDLTAIWKRRGRLPHAVEATGLITDAVLHDEVFDETKVSDFSIRATYALALNKFVTRLVDKHMKRKDARRSMYRTAKVMGLPEAFVEIRHEITHGELPSLIVLRKYAARALNWLWEHYWRRLTVERPGLLKSTLAFDGGEEHLKDCLRVTLRQFRDPRIQLARKKPNAFKQICNNKSTETTTTGLALFKICRNDSEALKVLSKVFLEGKFLVPSNRSLGDSMQTAFDVWSVLLKNLSLHNQDFLPQLVDKMLSVIGAPSKLDVRLDVAREALFEWLMLFFTSQTWKVPCKRRLSVGSAIHYCILNQNYWTRQITIKVAIKSSNPDIKLQWGNFAKAAILSCTGTHAAKEDELPSENSPGHVEEECSDSEEDERWDDPANHIDLEDMKYLATKGWKLAENWAPKPFGMG